MKNFLPQIKLSRAGHSERSEESKIVEIDSSVTAFPQNDEQVRRHCEGAIATAAIHRPLSKVILDCFDTNVPRNDGVKKCAFTLAEVLITLGVIGVVAAMTIPSLMTNYQKKQAATQLKKVYAEFHQALKLAIAENDDFEGWDFPEAYSKESSVEFFDKYLAKHMKATRLKDSECSQLADNDMYPCYQILNGVKFTIGVNPSKSAFINLDVNGISGPNMKGRDQFQISINTTRGVHFYGGAYTDREQLKSGVPINGGTAAACCSKECPTSWASKYTCARLIQVDGWEIRKDYPW